MTQGFGTQHLLMALPIPVLFNLCSTTIASQAYERVLELDPSNADALLGLASIKFNSSNVQQVRMQQPDLLMLVCNMLPNIPPQQGPHCHCVCY